MGDLELKTPVNLLGKTSCHISVDRPDICPQCSGGPGRACSVAPNRGTNCAITSAGCCFSSLDLLHSIPEVRPPSILSISSTVQQALTFLSRQHPLCPS